MSTDPVSTLAGRLGADVTLERPSDAEHGDYATNAAMRLERRGAKAVLSIKDDGIGFDSRVRSAGNGMRNMRERAQAMGGRLRITSKPGTGTNLRVTFPV